MALPRLCSTPLANSAKPAWKEDRKSTRLNSSLSQISYADFCLKKKPMLMDFPHLLRLDDRPRSQAPSSPRLAALAKTAYYRSPRCHYQRTALTLPPTWTIHRDT